MMVVLMYRHTKSKTYPPYLFIHSLARLSPTPHSLHTVPLYTLAPSSSQQRGEHVAQWWFVIPY